MAAVVDERHGAGQQALVDVALQRLTQAGQGKGVHGRSPGGHGMAWHGTPCPPSMRTQGGGAVACATAAGPAVSDRTYLHCSESRLDAGAVPR
jgi:hypothetical protein